MLEGKTVAVVVPAYDEERLIAATLQGIPGFVDRIFVVDDASGDATAERARSIDDPRVEVITNDQKRGVGAAIVTGYKRALAARMDAVAVMAGDNQMDPDELPYRLTLPISSQLVVLGVVIVVPGAGATRRILMFTIDRPSGKR